MPNPPVTGVGAQVLQNTPEIITPIISGAVRAPITLRGYTVATLPTGSIGQIAYATDLSAPTFLAVAVGGGAVKGPVFHNGTAWVTF